MRIDDGIVCQSRLAVGSSFAVDKVNCASTTELSSSLPSSSTPDSFSARSAEELAPPRF
jgi:hypothetical protein